MTDISASAGSQTGQRAHTSVLFLVDGTETMGEYIQAFAASCSHLSQFCDEKFPNTDFSFGSVVYRDRLVNPDDKNEKCSFTKDANKIAAFLGQNRPCGGGSDGPDDWFGGYKMAIQMRWHPGKKLIIHITDAPGHGRRLLSPDDNSTEVDVQHYDSFADEHFPILVRLLPKSGIRVFGICADNYASNYFRKTKKIYDEAVGGSDTYKIFNIEEADKTHISEVIDRMIKNAIELSMSEQIKAEP